MLRFRRALRHAFMILSALSLLLCVAVCVLWVRSYCVSDQFRWVERKDDGAFTTYDRNILLGRGVVIYGERMLASGDPTYAGRWERQLKATGMVPYVRSGPYNSFWNRRGTLGFIVERSYRRELRTAVPFWFIALCFALPALPAFRSITRKVRNRRRHREVTCLSCGYDLRASPERCPECGRIVQGGG